jgi:hypothetical protein
VLGRLPIDPEFVRTCLDMGAEGITPFASAPLATASLRYHREGHYDDDDD